MIPLKGSRGIRRGVSGCVYKEREREGKVIRCKSVYVQKNRSQILLSNVSATRDERDSTALQNLFLPGH